MGKRELAFCIKGNIGTKADLKGKLGIKVDSGKQFGISLTT